MERKENTMSVSPGCIVLNGSIVRCVTDFKYECTGSNIAAVTMAFEVPVQNVSITNQNNTEEIRIPIKIGDTLVDEIVIPQEEDVVSRKELLELALPTVERKIKTAATGDIAVAKLEKYLKMHRKITDELQFLTDKEE